MWQGPHETDRSATGNAINQYVCQSGHTGLRFSGIKNVYMHLIRHYLLLAKRHQIVRLDSAWVMKNNWVIQFHGQAITGM